MIIAYKMTDKNGNSFDRSRRTGEHLNYSEGKTVSLNGCVANGEATPSASSNPGASDGGLRIQKQSTHSKYKKPTEKKTAKNNKKQNIGRKAPATKRSTKWHQKRITASAKSGKKK